MWFQLYYVEILHPCLDLLSRNFEHFFSYDVYWLCFTASGDATFCTVYNTIRMYNVFSRTMLVIEFSGIDIIFLLQAPSFSIHVQYIVHISLLFRFCNVVITNSIISYIKPMWYLLIHALLVSKSKRYDII